MWLACVFSFLKLPRPCKKDNVLLVSGNVLANLEFSLQKRLHILGRDKRFDLSVHFRCFPVVITFRL